MTTPGGRGREGPDRDPRGVLRGQLLSSEMLPMALIKLLVAPIRRVVNFPLFQLTAAGSRQQIGFR
jgi:hypothetical protein